MTIIHRSTRCPNHARLYGLAKGRQATHPARPLPPPRTGRALRDIFSRAAYALRALTRGAAPATPAGLDSPPCPAAPRTFSTRQESSK